jgi:hypothetical protein
MSRIYFNSPSETAEIYGAERHHAERLCQDLMCREFGEDEDEWIELLRPYLPEYVRYGRPNDIKIYLGSSFCGGELDIEGHKFSTWHAMLNTGIEKGSQGLRLLTRLHGQCEMHCWVDGHNRDWLAGIIDEGIAESVLRIEAGWPELATFLRTRNDEPVVCSFSVGEDFPNYEMLPDTHRLKKMAERGDDIDDVVGAYDRMRWSTRWKYCMQNLRTMDGLREMKPENWETYYFERGITVGRLIGALRAAASQDNDTSAAGA